MIFLYIFINFYWDCLWGWDRNKEPGSLLFWLGPDEAKVIGPELDGSCIFCFITTSRENIDDMKIEIL